MQLGLKNRGEQVDCVAALIINGGQILAEKRKFTKIGDPGAVMLPGGHVEIGEPLEAAFYREMQEELGIVPYNIHYICTLLNKSHEIQKINYYAVDAWSGTIQNYEAESLLWISINDPREIENAADRVAIQEFLRISAS